MCNLVLVHTFVSATNSIMHSCTCISLEYVCYDDGCHLRRFAQNPLRKDVTPTSRFLASLEILVDKMHMAGHVDKWCRETCDSRKVSELDEVKLLLQYVLSGMHMTHFPCRWTQKYVNKHLLGYLNTQK